MVPKAKRRQKKQYSEFTFKRGIYSSAPSSLGSRCISISFILLSCILLSIDVKSQVVDIYPEVRWIKQDLDQSTYQKIKSQNPKIELVSAEPIAQGQDIEIEFLVTVDNEAKAEIICGEKAQCLRNQAFPGPLPAGSTVFIETSGLKKGVYLLMINKDPSMMMRFEIQ